MRTDNGRVDENDTVGGEAGGHSGPAQANDSGADVAVDHGRVARRLSEQIDPHPGGRIWS